MQAILVVLLCVTSAVAYGVVHDQITARVCVEYFTIDHLPVFTTADLKPVATPLLPVVRTTPAVESTDAFIIVFARAGGKMAAGVEPWKNTRPASISSRPPHRLCPARRRGAPGFDGRSSSHLSVG